jgi:hypothetical protein
MFLILREPADLLATAFITYGNEDRLTRKNQQLSQELSTAGQWMLSSNNPLYTRERSFKHRYYLRQRTPKTSTKLSLPARLIVETSAPSGSLTSRRNQLRRNRPSLRCNLVKEPLDFVKSFCKVYEASCYTADSVINGSSDGECTLFP